MNHVLKRFSVATSSFLIGSLFAMGINIAVATDAVPSKPPPDAAIIPHFDGVKIRNAATYGKEMDKIPNTLDVWVESQQPLGYGARIWSFGTDSIGMQVSAGKTAIEAVDKDGTVSAKVAHIESDGTRYAFWTTPTGTVRAGNLDVTSQLYSFGSNPVKVNDSFEVQGTNALFKMTNVKIQGTGNLEVPNLKNVQTINGIPIEDFGGTGTPTDLEEENGCKFGMVCNNPTGNPNKLRIPARSWNSIRNGTIFGGMYFDTDNDGNDESQDRASLDFGIFGTKVNNDVSRLVIGDFINVERQRNVDRTPRFYFDDRGFVICNRYGKKCIGIRPRNEDEGDAYDPQAPESRDTFQVCIGGSDACPDGGRGTNGVYFYGSEPHTSITDEGLYTTEIVTGVTSTEEIYTGDVDGYSYPTYMQYNNELYKMPNYPTFP